MRWVAVLCALGACIKADPPVVCGERICPTASVCLADGTCALRPASPTRFALDNRSSNTDLIDIPVLVTLDPSTVDYSVVADPELDLGFRTADTDQDLPFEIERWNPYGDSLVWTRLPRVAATTDSDAIVVHFGSGANRLQPEPSMVWSDYDLVVHGTDSFESSAPPAYPAEASNLSHGAGVVGDAIAFPDTQDGRLVFHQSEPLLDGWNRFSFGFWLYADYDAAALNYEASVIGKDASGSLAAGRLYHYPGLDDIVAFQIDVWFTSGAAYDSIFVSPRTWTYIVYTFDGQAMRIFRDGALAGYDRTPTPDSLRPDPSVLVLGTSSPSLKGMIDELRITRRTLTPDEVRADYRSQTAQLLRAP